jgi:hypothetical protein
MDMTDAAMMATIAMKLRQLLCIIVCSSGTDLWI